MTGYEIHNGRTTVNGEPFCRLADGTPEGCVCKNVFGTYLHGLFDSGELTQALVKLLCARKGISPRETRPTSMAEYRQAQFDLLADGVRKALLAHKAFAVYDAGGYSDLMTGEDAVKLWESHNTDVGGSFNINPPIPRILLAQVKRPDGAFVVDAISTDGGCIPRNVILSQGLSLVKLDVLTLTEFAQKTSLNPARMLRLKDKGHLSVGADADITIYDYAAQTPKMSFVEGRKVLFKGEVLGKNANIICTERGQKAIEARGLKAIVVDPGLPVDRVKAL